MHEVTIWKSNTSVTDLKKEIRVRVKQCKRQDRIKMNKTAHWMSLTKKLQLMEHQSHTSTHMSQLQEMPQQI